MQYRVYGLDAISQEPRPPLTVEADSEEAARRRASDLGLAVHQVEALHPRPELGTGVPMSDRRSERPDTSRGQLRRLGSLVHRRGYVLAGIVAWVIAGGFGLFYQTVEVRAGIGGMAAAVTTAPSSVSGGAAGGFAVAGGLCFVAAAVAGRGR